jgi:hypothetical protein
MTFEPEIHAENDRKSDIEQVRIQEKFYTLPGLSSRVNAMPTGESSMEAVSVER